MIKLPSAPVSNGRLFCMSIEENSPRINYKFPKKILRVANVKRKEENLELSHSLGIRIIFCKGDTLCTESPITEVTLSKFKSIKVMGDLFVHHCKILENVEVIGNATIFKCELIKNLKVFGRLTVFAVNPMNPVIEKSQCQSYEEHLMYPENHCELIDNSCREVVLNGYTSVCIQGDCSKIERIIINSSAKEVTVNVAYGAKFYGTVVGGTLIQESSYQE